MPAIPKPRLPQSCHACEIFLEKIYDSLSNFRTEVIHTRVLVGRKGAVMRSEDFDIHSQPHGRSGISCKGLMYQPDKQRFLKHAEGGEWDFPYFIYEDSCHSNVRSIVSSVRGIFGVGESVQGFVVMAGLLGEFCSYFPETVGKERRVGLQNDVQNTIDCSLNICVLLVETNRDLSVQNQVTSKTQPCEQSRALLMYSQCVVRISKDSWHYWLVAAS
ncbi:unnamed protein product [Chondrus crispus]|uniref:Uncharacterized protein n=1 Tax=Chondrus crispus TaxID=2769 RepID=R7Q5R9_CHOCR|nr:unnamed protein product [Chondrus crispus]CDF33183.1 unnamed protein product [Chondrus crispus]|eukprot:XP_005712986.1 unnamed protein product [Chondrus crispus]